MKHQKSVLGEFKLQRAGSLPVFGHEGIQHDEETQELFELMQDAEESRELTNKRTRTRAKPSWEH